MIVKPSSSEFLGKQVPHELKWRKRDIAAKLVHIVVMAIQKKMARNELQHIEKDFVVGLAKGDILASLEVLPEKGIKEIDLVNTDVWKSRELVEHAINRILRFTQKRSTA